MDRRFTEEEENEGKLLATCSNRLYPNVPTPPLPASVPLASYIGHYRHPAYDSIFISLECEDDKSDSTASPGVQDTECQLRLKRGTESQSQFYGNLTHITGDFWLTYIALSFLDVAQGCLRTEFRLDPSGTVAAVGIDARLEGENIPLVWFDRVNQ